MKIENEQLKTALFGALKVWEENGNLKMFRFTQKQKEHFVEVENYIHKLWKSRAASCMNIDFYTDSETLKMSTHCYRASSVKKCGFDIYIDGVMKENYSFDADEPFDPEFSVNLGSGKKRVTIYLPYSFATEIKNFEIDDNALFEPAVKDTKIMFFGDSITQGYITEFPSLIYSNIVARNLNAECVNQGIGAALYDADDLDTEIPFDPDTVFVAFGTNDWGHDCDIDKTSDEYLKKLRATFPKAKIYVILPLWRGNVEERTPGRKFTFERLHEIIDEVCQKYDNVTVIDGMELIPHSTEFFCPDKTHPNALGHVFYGNELSKRIMNK